MRPGGLRRGTTAQPLPIDRHVTGRCLAPDPVAQGLFQRGDIQLLEQFAPHRWGGHPLTLYSDGRQCFAVQSPSPAHDAQLITPARQHRGHRDKQETGKRITPAFRPPVVRDRHQCLPKTARLHRGRIHPRIPQGGKSRDQNRDRAAPPPQKWTPDLRTKSPWGST